MKHLYLFKKSILLVLFLPVTAFMQNLSPDEQSELQQAELALTQSTYNMPPPPGNQGDEDINEDFTPTAGATETFTPVVGDKFYDTGGPGGSTYPSYDGPGDYVNCGCTTYTTLAGVTEFKFNEFIIFEGFDYLKIYDGTDTSGTLLFDNEQGGMNSGVMFLDDLIASHGSDTFTSSTGNFHFEFYASTVVGYIGWEAEITAVDGGGDPGECIMTPLTLTGFNADTIAEGSGGDADDKSDYSIDAQSWFANIYYSEDFVPENPANYSSAAEYGGGLPADGSFTSLSSGVEYQFADYAAENTVLLRNTVTNSVTLTLSEPLAAESLYFATASSEGTHQVNVTVHFDDGSTQEGSFETPDWYQVSPPDNTIAYGFGRISRGTGSAATVNTFSDLGIMGIFEEIIPIEEENYSKPITSISFDKVVTDNDASTTVVFAVSACEHELLGINDLSRSSFGFYPNPTRDFVMIKSEKKINDVQVFNIAGQKAVNVKPFEPNQKIDISPLPAGVYIFRVQLDGGQIETFKIIKK